MTDLEAIFKSHHQKMVIVAKGIVGEVYAEDMVSDAFLKMQEKGYECEPKLLLTLVINCSLNHIKHEKRKKLKHKDIFNMSDDYLEALETKAELISIIVKEIESQPEGRKKVIKLWQMGYNHREIAEILGLASGTVDIHMKRFRDYIKPIIKK